MLSKTSDNIILDRRPPSDIIQHFAEFSITLTVHQQKIQLHLDPHCEESAEIIQNYFALHVGLSLIEYVLQNCSHVAYWLKDHFLPSNHIIFTNEVCASKIQIDEILNIVRDSSKWPHIIFKDNKQIRSMLHTKKIDN